MDARETLAQLPEPSPTVQQRAHDQQAPTVADPIEGRMEATDTTRFFRFKDDVVIRVRPTEDGTGSIVDMRSISRVGVSDLGVNAKRVRSFIADLAGTNPAG